MTSNSAKRTRKTWKNRITGLLIWCCPVIVAYLCSVFVVQAAVVQDHSMSPALHDKQFVILNKWDHTYGQGDVIAFSCEDLKCLLVKRIVGVPGDEILIRDGRVWRNGEILEEYFSVRDETEKYFLVPEDCYFVLGDNYEDSVDSRDSRVGFVKKEMITGKVFFFGNN